MCKRFELIQSLDFDRLTVLEVVLAIRPRAARDSGRDSREMPQPIKLIIAVLLVTRLFCVPAGRPGRPRAVGFFEHSVNAID